MAMTKSNASILNAFEGLAQFISNGQTEIKAVKKSLKKNSRGKTSKRINKERQSNDPSLKFAINAALSQLIADYGTEIFDIENKRRLCLLVQELEPSLEIFKARFAIACLNDIPQKIYGSLDMPKKERKLVVKQNLEWLTMIGLSKKIAKEFISVICIVLGMDEFEN